ncbi:MAG: TetR/AcrR family transcriptional regulator [Acidimicrobiales bacterium]
MTVETRPYLRSDQRRRQLLDAAARLFVREGLTGMTMAALAREADASRRLVYDHFADLSALYDAFFDDRCGRYLEQLDRAIDGVGDGDPVVAAFTALLAVPTEDQRAIRLLVADTSTPELDQVRTRLRRRLERRWRGRLDRLGVDEGLTRAVLWTSIGTVLALADLVGRDELTVDQAVELVTASVRAMVGAAASAPTAATTATTSTPTTRHRRNPR